MYDRFCTRSCRERNIPNPGKIDYVNYVEKTEDRCWIYASTLQQAKHEGSELYRFKPGNVGNSHLTENDESDEEDDETHSAECILVNDVRRGGDSDSETDDSNEPRIPNDEDIATRAQAGIAATFRTTYDSLMLCLSRTTSRPPTQRRYINKKARTAYKR